MKTIFFFFSLVFFSYSLCAQDVYRLEKIQSNVSFDLLSISLSADDYGCISGRSDTILITRDGGKSWKPKRLIYTDTIIKRIERVHVIDSLSSFALAVLPDEEIRLLFTDNGWLTYNVVNMPKPFINVIIKSSDTIFHLGQDLLEDDNFVIRFSHDLGKNWTELGTARKVDRYTSLWLNKETLIVQTNVPYGTIKQYEFTLFDLKKKESKTYRRIWGTGCNLSHIMNGILMSNKDIYGSFTEPCMFSPVFLYNGDKSIIPDTPNLDITYALPVRSPYANNFLIVEKHTAQKTFEYGYMETTNNGQSWIFTPFDNTSSTLLRSLFNVHDSRTVTKTKQGIIVIGKDGTILQTATTTDIHEYENVNDNKDIQLSPNPALNTINLNITIKNGYVSNSFGEKVLFVNEATNTLDISHLPIGYYFLNVTTPSGTITKPFIKQ